MAEVYMRTITQTAKLVYSILLALLRKRQVIDLYIGFNEYYMI